MLCPSATVNSLTVVMFRPRMGTGVWSVSASGPAIARSPRYAARDPRHDMPVVEAKHHPHSHRHGASTAADNSNDIYLLMTIYDRHEVDHLNHPTVGHEFGFPG